MNRREFLKLMGATGSYFAVQSILPQFAWAEANTNVYRIEGMTADIEEPEVQQYLRTGALQFWVAGVFTNTWMKNLDFRTLNATEDGRHLISYFRNAGNASRTLSGAERIWDSIPRHVRMGGVQSLRAFLSSRDWSHFFPRSWGGSDDANYGIFENRMINRGRGARPMTDAEIRAAQRALRVDAIGHAVGNAAKLLVTGALVALVVETVLAVMEYGLLHHSGEIGTAELFNLVWPRITTTLAVTVVVAGLIAGLVMLFPPLMPVMAVVGPPMALAGFLMFGQRFYRLSKEWLRELGVNRALLLVDRLESAPGRIWSEANDSSSRILVNTKETSGWIWSEVEDASGRVWLNVYGPTRLLLQGTKDSSTSLWDQAIQLRRLSE